MVSSMQHICNAPFQSSEERRRAIAHITNQPPNIGLFSYRALPPYLRADPAIALAAVHRNGWALKFAPTTIRDDRSVVLVATRMKGEALRFVSDVLRNDEEVVMGAVRQYGLALEYASDALRGDCEVVRAACFENRGALEHADVLGLARGLSARNSGDGLDGFPLAEFVSLVCSDYELTSVFLFVRNMDFLLRN